MNIQVAQNKKFMIISRSLFSKDEKKMELQAARTPESFYEKLNQVQHSLLSPDWLLNENLEKVNIKSISFLALKILNFFAKIFGFDLLEKFRIANVYFQFKDYCNLNRAILKENFLKFEEKISEVFLLFHKKMGARSGQNCFLLRSGEFFSLDLERDYQNLLDLGPQKGINLNFTMEEVPFKIWTQFEDVVRKILTIYKSYRFSLEITTSLIEICEKSLKKNHVVDTFRFPVSPQVLEGLFQNTYLVDFEGAYTTFLLFGPKKDLTITEAPPLEKLEISFGDWQAFQSALKGLTPYRDSRYYYELHKSSSRFISILQKQLLGAPLLIKKIPIPFSIYFDPHSRDIIVLSKAIVGEGAHRKIRACCLLENGTLLVRGKCGQLEKKVLTHLKEHPSRGLPGVYGWRCTEQKTQFFQEVYDGTLQKFLTPDGLEPKAQKLHIIYDLLTGLEHLHSLEKDGDTYYHGDLSTNNVLIKQGQKCSAAVLTDFDASTEYSVVTLSPGYLPPEYGAWLKGMRPAPTSPLESQRQSWLKEMLSETETFNRRYGQKKDIWGLGLIFLTILVGPIFDDRLEVKLSTFANLRVIRRWVDEMATKKLSDSRQLSLFYALISSVSQEEIDEDLKGLKDFFEDSNKTKVSEILWEVIKGMLQVDPEKRISAKEALSKLSPYELTLRKNEGS